MGFPGVSEVKNPPANAGDSGSSPVSVNCLPTQIKKFKRKCILWHLIHSKICKP